MSLTQRLFIALQYVLPHHCLSRLVGRLAECEKPAIKNALIRRFIRQYQVNMAEAERKQPEEFVNFNDFFTRSLVPGARPIDPHADGIASPADGAISQLGDIRHGRVFQAKGHDYSLYELLGGDSERAALFADGSFATVYLSPRDYHRVHMPITGTLREMVYVPGKLFSVNQTTAENVPELFARNERAVCIFDTAAGPMAVVLVGAMIVAGIETVWAGQVAPPAHSLQVHDYSEQGRQPIVLNKGDELGRFKLGSTAIVLFGAGQAHWNEALSEGSPLLMGQQIGQLLVDTPATASATQ